MKQMPCSGEGREVSMNFCIVMTSASGGIVYRNQNRLPGLSNETKSGIPYACSVH